MKFEEHCKRSKEKFGDEYREVHKFLDQYSGILGWKHRYLLHNEEGIELIHKKFGAKAALVARQHIKDDDQEEEGREWEGKLHFCGDCKNTEAWFIKKNGDPQHSPTLNFVFCPEKTLKWVRKLDGKNVVLSIREERK